MIPYHPLQPGSLEGYSMGPHSQDRRPFAAADQGKIWF